MRKISIIILFFAAFILTIPDKILNAEALRIETNLVKALITYPVLVEAAGERVATGFYMLRNKKLFFVTAKHVLFDEEMKIGEHNEKIPIYHQKYSTISLLSYRDIDGNMYAAQRAHLDLGAISADGRIKYSTNDDVVIIVLGIETSTENGSNEIGAFEGITLEKPNVGLSFVSGDNQVATITSVVDGIGDDALVFGYPFPLGDPIIGDQLEPDRPLLRRGAIAGINPNLRTIVIECPNYPGNSGSPVLQITPFVEDGKLKKKYALIGLVSQFVPFRVIKKDSFTRYKYLSVEYQNADYSIIEPVDAIFELMDTIKIENASRGPG